MKVLRNVTAALLSATMVLSVGTPLRINDVLATEKYESETYSYYNNRHCSTVNNYVFEREDGGLTTVETDAYYEGYSYFEDENKTVINVHEYAGSSKPERDISIPMELPLWGGFFHGEKYNFFVYGQRNDDKNDKCEVIRIVKYSQDWKRLDACSISGINTYYPFNCGNLRMDEQDGFLYIATCHEMYNWHQASLNLIIDESTMKMIDSHHLVANGVYCSHSFDQYIQIVGDYVYRIDLGDAYPRGILFSKTDMYDPEFDYENGYESEYDSNTNEFNYIYENSPIDKNTKHELFFEFPGDTGDNYTGCYIGGFEMSGDKAIVAGKSIDYTKEFVSDSSAIFPLNVFVVTGTIDGHSALKYLTSYNDVNKQPEPSVPQLVKINDDKFIVIWEETYYERKVTSEYDPDFDFTWTSVENVFLSSSTKYVVIDSTGKTISDYYTLDAKVTDCKPVLCSDDVIRWFYNERINKDSYISPLYTHKAEINVKTLKSSDSIVYGFDYQKALNLTDETGVAGFIERLYSVTLGRGSDDSGKTYWINHVKKEDGTGSELAMNFLGSQEFANKELSDVDFVCALYATFFGRQHEESGLRYWLNQLATGVSREAVITGFIMSEEFANICLTYGIPSGTNVTPTVTVEANDDVKGFAERLYTKCLNRDSDKEGLEYWAIELANMRKSGSVVAGDFFFSKEFIDSKTTNEEYVTRLYRTFMDREPEKKGFNYWVGEMKAGRMTRADVFDGFAASPEWADICASYGILK